MSLFQQALEKIEENRFKEYNCIPFYDVLPNFSYFLPGIQQKRYYLLTGASGSGKSQLADHLFVFTPYNFIKDYQTPLKIKIFYFSLEMDKQSKITQWIARRLFDKYHINTDINILQSMGKNRLTDEVFMAVQETRDYFEQLEQYLEILDGDAYPTKIYKTLEAYAHNNGKVIKKKHVFNHRDDNGKLITEEGEIFDTYKANNPDEYVICILDHYYLMTMEKRADNNAKKNIENMSKDFVKIKNRYNYTIVPIQQLSAESEDIDHYKASKMEPSKQLLSDSKQTYNDADYALGIFQPQKHEIKTYRGYNILEMGDRYRNLNLFKNRYGESNVNKGLYFDGAVNFFKELPKSDNMNPDIYAKIKKASPYW